MNKCIPLTRPVPRSVAGVPAFFGTPYLDRLALAIDPLDDAVNYTTMSKLVVDG